MKFIQFVGTIDSCFYGEIKEDFFLNWKKSAHNKWGFKDNLNRSNGIDLSK